MGNCDSLQGSSDALGLMTSISSSQWRPAQHQGPDFSVSPHHARGQAAHLPRPRHSPPN